MASYSACGYLYILQYTQYLHLEVNINLKLGCPFLYTVLGMPGVGGGGDGGGVGMGVGVGMEVGVVPANVVKNIAVLVRDSLFGLRVFNT